MARIHVHSHAVLPKYRQYLLGCGYDRPDAIPEIPADNLLTHGLSVNKARLTIAGMER